MPCMLAGHLLPGRLRHCQPQARLVLPWIITLIGMTSHGDGQPAFGDQGGESGATGA
jgi:hypothetical protein